MKKIIGTLNILLTTVILQLSALTEGHIVLLDADVILLDDEVSLSDAELRNVCGKLKAQQCKSLSDTLADYDRYSVALRKKITFNFVVKRRSHSFDPPKDTSEKCVLYNPNFTIIELDAKDDVAFRKSVASWISSWRSAKAYVAYYANLKSSLTIEEQKSFMYMTAQLAGVQGLVENKCPKPTPKRKHEFLRRKEPDTFSRYATKKHPVGTYNKARTNNLPSAVSANWRKETFMQFAKKYLVEGPQMLYSNRMQQLPDPTVTEKLAMKAGKSNLYSGKRVAKEDKEMLLKLQTFLLKRCSEHLAVLESPCSLPDLSARLSQSVSKFFCTAEGDSANLFSDENAIQIDDHQFALWYGSWLDIEHTLNVLAQANMRVAATPKVRMSRAARDATLRVKSPARKKSATSISFDTISPRDTTLTKSRGLTANEEPVKPLRVYKMSDRRISNSGLRSTHVSMSPTGAVRGHETGSVAPGGVRRKDSLAWKSAASGKTVKKIDARIPADVLDKLRCIDKKKNPTLIVAGVQAIVNGLIKVILCLG